MIHIHTAVNYKIKVRTLTDVAKLKKLVKRTNLRVMVF